MKKVGKILIFLIFIIIILSINFYFIFLGSSPFKKNENRLILKLEPIEKSSCVRWYETKGESMYPTINSSNIVEVNICSSVYNLDLDDIIAYKNEYGGITGHRIVFLDFGTKIIITKGDNNEILDDPINFSQYYGKIIGVYNE